MKWIGQHIYDLVSRFREDVYLEDVSSGTIASGGNLGLDSNNKIVKAAEVGSAVDLTSEVTGTLPVANGGTGATSLATDGILFGNGTSAISAVDLSTSGNIIVGGDNPAVVTGANLAGAGLAAVVGDGTLVLSVEASQTQITSVGTIGTGTWQGTTIKTAYIGDDQVTEDKLADTLLAEIDANTAKVTNVATDLSASTHASQIRINSSDGENVIIAEASGSIAGVMSVTHHDKLDAIEAEATADQSKSDIDGLAITTVGTLDTGNATAIVDAASLTAAGKVELATTGEADSGTDTDRAVTPAGLKSHVDTKYSYSYMVLSASAIPKRDGSNNPEWMVPNVLKGIFEEDWNKDTNIIETGVGTATYSFSKQITANALIVPHAGILVGFHAIGRNNAGDRTFKAGLFHADNGLGGAGADGSAGEGIDYGNTAANHEFSLRCVATAVETEASGGTDGTTNHSFSGPCKLISNTANLQLQAGDALMPAIMGNSTNSTDEIFVTMTIILKIPLV